ncbi:MAG: DUF4291 domain-containing protein [Cyclobacteriaceae bacterium]|nr:DUF4291 domain-containing protein [Cyclobacteriaceae bacterium]
MNIIQHTDQRKNIPVTGNFINAQFDDSSILVYQAFRKSIADFALQEQFFGGPDYKFTRMSWIKPSFLWMMYRSGWAQKEGQEKILGIWISRHFFDTLLACAVHSTFSNDYYQDENQWRNALSASEIRLQWDPDHDPYGIPTPRKTIQLGLKGELLKEFATKVILKIEDVTAFATEQFKHIEQKDLNNLKVPYETLYYPQDLSINRKIGLN